MKIARLLLLIGCSLSLPAFADQLVYTAFLSGANENPSTGSPGTGSAEVFINTVAQTMRVEVTFSGLEAGDTAAHIHCCVSPGGNAGVATITPTFTGFPGGVTAGSYDHTFDLTSSGTYNPAFITANGGLANAESVLLAGLAAGNAYLNIHSSMFPGGEIRGFLAPVPEPSSLVLLAISLIGVAGVMKRKIAG